MFVFISSIQDLDVWFVSLCICGCSGSSYHRGAASSSTAEQQQQQQQQQAAVAAAAGGYYNYNAYSQYPQPPGLGNAFYGQSYSSQGRQSYGSYTNPSMWS